MHPARCVSLIAKTRARIVGLRWHVCGSQDFMTAAGLDSYADAVYSRVMKELCSSRGSNWTLKSGEPWAL